MSGNLLSVDWDYFVPLCRDWCGSYLENKRNVSLQWYKRYLKYKNCGKDITKSVDAGYEWTNFWNKVIKKHFDLTSVKDVFVSGSHKFSYDIAKEFDLKRVFSFDAHSDLGYGGLGALDFEINCANWLGKLLKESIIKEANIIYSPYTHENIVDFKELNKAFNINYCSLKDLQHSIPVHAIHICRSGAWTPPWLDPKFESFIKSLGMPYKVISYSRRKWDVNNHSELDNFFLQCC